MHHPLVTKLGHGVRLTDADRAKLRDAAARTRRVGPRQDLLREDEPPGDVRVVLEGFACRKKALPGGGRQVMAFLLPGDFCDLHAAVLGRTDHAVGTLTPCTVADIPPAAVEELTAEHPRLRRALWWATLVDEAILREWLVNVGRRPADQRLAHLLCELLARLGAVGLADADGCGLPLAAADLGDTLGLSPVRLNLSLQRLRADGLAALEAGRLRVLDAERLRAFGEFDPSYLHLRPAPGAGDGARD